MGWCDGGSGNLTSVDVRSGIEIEEEKREQELSEEWFRRRGTVDQSVVRCFGCLSLCGLEFGQALVCLHLSWKSFERCVYCLAMVSLQFAYLYSVAREAWDSVVFRSLRCSTSTNISLAACLSHLFACRIRHMVNCLSYGTTKLEPRSHYRGIKLFLHSIPPLSPQLHSENVPHTLPAQRHQPSPFVLTPNNTFPQCPPLSQHQSNPSMKPEPLKKSAP